MKSNESILTVILSGYARTGLKTLRVLGIAAAAAALGFIIVWPLWYAAVHVPRFYSIFAIILLPVGAALYGLYKVYRRGTMPVTRVIIHFLKKSIIILLCLFLLLVSVFLFLAGSIAPGTIASVIFLLVSGYFTYRRA